MRQRMAVLGSVLLISSIAIAADTWPPDPTPLAGQWDFLAGHGDDDVAAAPEKFTGWEKIAVPGIWPPGQLACAWEVVRFKAPAEAKGLDCEIQFERVHWAAQVWLNGKKLGGCPDGYAPFRLLASEAIKPGAENVLAVRVGGFAEVPKAKCGKPLFPAGFAMAGRGGGGGVMGRVWVRFFRGVRLTRVQVFPDLAASTAKVLVRVEGNRPETLVELIVREDKSGAEAGRDGRGVKLAGGSAEASFSIPIKDIKTWSPASPFLYRVEVKAKADDGPGDRVSERFGMREFLAKPDGFYLNGRKIRLVGANLIGDYGYWWGATNLLERDKIKSVLVDPARAINANCVRTHTAPIPKWWLDLCDEEGLLVLLEFPVTVNCGKIDFDDAELAAFKKNLMDEASAIVPYLANHPSIVMWVPTNESNNWHEWERTELWRHFKKLDPSRPTIRASYDTPDAIDVHSYAAMWKGSCGDFEFRLRCEADRARRENVPAMVTEYLGGMDLRVTRKWFGPMADSSDAKVRQRLAGLSAEFHAARAMEQTEAARRLDYAGILPFGPGFWTGRPDQPPSPTFHAIRSSLAPVGVSIDLANHHFVAGQGYSSDVWVMNDTNEKVAAKVRLQLSQADPGFDPEAALPEAISQSGWATELGPQAGDSNQLTWKLPDKEGQYFLLAKLERSGAPPVTSRRAIWAIRRESPPAGLAGKKLLVIEEGQEGSRRLSDWAGKLGCQVLDPKSPLADAQLVIVAPRAASGEAFKKLAAEIPGYVQKGGRVLVLEQFDWPKLKDLLGIQLERTDYDYDDDNAPADQRAEATTRISVSQASGGSSRVFRWEQPERDIWKGIPDEYLADWNGQHGRVARASMSTLPGRARVLVRYAEAERDDLKFVPVAVVAHGQGEVLYFMLHLAGRYDPADPEYDPVVERLMLNLLNY